MSIFLLLILMTSTTITFSATAYLSKITNTATSTSGELRMCTPVISDSLDIRCTFNGDKVNCSEPSIPGTTLIPHCKSTHTVPNGNIEIPINLHCQHDGTWNNKLYSCVPKCGVPFVPQKNFTLNSIKSTTKVPWSVAIYNKSELICGGTLISPNLVVTAAQCFWVSGLPDNTFRNNGVYKIAVGKFERDISIMDDIYTQIIDVGYVYMEPDYFGLNGNHANDMAVVVLSSHVVMSKNVMPICVDWFSVHGVQNGHIGKIAGWGTTENGTKSSHLLEASLPYIDIVTCRKRYKNGFERYLSNDKFCAGTESGQGIDQGDRGAGFTIGYNGLHFLVGVENIKDPEKRDSVAAFTNVKSHIEWIRSVYTSYTAITLT